MYRIVFQSTGAQATTALSIFLFMLFVAMTALTIQQRKYLGKKKLLFFGMMVAAVGSFILGFVFLFNTLLRSSKKVVLSDSGIYITYISGSESVKWRDVETVQRNSNPISDSMVFYLRDGNQVYFDLTYIERIGEIEDIVRQSVKLQEF